MKRLCTGTKQFYEREVLIVMNFVVVDVETANPNSASICQGGIAPFRDGGRYASQRTARPAIL